MGLEFKKSKNKKNIWFVFDKKYYFNKNEFNDYYDGYSLIKNKSVQVYNYSMNEFYSCFLNEEGIGKFFGIKVSLYNKDGLYYFNDKTGNINRY